MKQCDNGHFYDEARFESCPYCKENTGIGKTMAAADIGKTVAAFPGNPAAAAATAFDSGKTVAVMKKKIGIDPAVGFLICIEGPHRGTDFRLVSGRNFIGRAAAMDVSLPDDDTVSRESHALVTYDEQVEMVHPLKAYDIIEVGKSRLLFLPLCSQQFQWSEE